MIASHSMEVEDKVLPSIFRCLPNKKTIVINSSFLILSLITTFVVVGDDISVLWLADYCPHDIPRICDANCFG